MEDEKIDVFIGSVSSVAEFGILEMYAIIESNTYFKFISLLCIQFHVDSTLRRKEFVCRYAQ